MHDLRCLNFHTAFPMSLARSLNLKVSFLGTPSPHNATSYVEHILCTPVYHLNRTMLNPSRPRALNKGVSHHPPTQTQLITTAFPSVNSKQDQPEREGEILTFHLAYRCQHDTAATGRGGSGEALLLIRYVGHCANRHTQPTVKHRS